MRCADAHGLGLPPQAHLDQCPGGMLPSRTVHTSPAAKTPGELDSILLSTRTPPSAASSTCPSSHAVLGTTPVAFSTTSTTRRSPLVSVAVTAWLEGQVELA